MAPPVFFRHLPPLCLSPYMMNLFIKESEQAIRTERQSCRRDVRMMIMEALSPDDVPATVAHILGTHRMLDTTWAALPTIPDLPAPRGS